MVESEQSIPISFTQALLAFARLRKCRPKLCQNFVNSCISIYRVGLPKGNLSRLYSLIQSMVPLPTGQESWLRSACVGKVYCWHCCRAVTIQTCDPFGLLLFLGCDMDTNWVPIGCASEFNADFWIQLENLRLSSKTSISGRRTARHGRRSPWLGTHGAA